MRFFMILFFLFIFCNDLLPSYCFGVTPEQFASYGIMKYKNGHYRESISCFKELNKQYPFTDYSFLAGIRIAQSYSKLGNYLEAISEYVFIERIFPIMDFLPYLIYQSGYAYFSQGRSFHENNICLDMALKQYYKLNKKFPKSQYLSIARLGIEECYKKTISYELSIGIFYYNRSEYEASLSRFLKIISFYPCSIYHTKVLFYLTDCEKRMNSSFIENVDGIVK